MPEAPRASDHLLEGLALVVTRGSAAGTPALKHALTAFRAESVGLEEQLPWLWLAGRAAGHIWDYDSWDVLTARQVEVARDRGAIAVLPLTFSIRAGVHLFAGELNEAIALLRELDSVIDATQGRIVPYAPLTATAFRGREQEARHLVDAGVHDFLTRGEGMALTMAHWATAVLCNGVAKYEDAFAAAQEVLEDPDELWFSSLATVELVEAASRTGKEHLAAPAFERLVEGTDASGTEWALAVQARCRALLSDGEHTEELYREALDRLAPTAVRLDLARTRLLYGEWLRREHRLRDARDQLRTAHGLFTDFGMEGFARRAEAEMRAAGDRARKRSPEKRYDLTPQEERISELAAQGTTNKEIAAQLFVSPSTVEYHLHKVFRKLDITSRSQLGRRLVSKAKR